MKLSFKSWLGHQLRELILHLQRITYPKARKRVIFLPWSSPQVNSCRERAYNIAQKLRERGWRVVIIPSQLDLEQRRRIIKWEDPSIVFIELARHPLNRPNLYPGYKIVFDIDDGDFLDPSSRPSVIQCCEGSDLVLAGSKFVADFCRQYNPNTQIVWTGMALETKNYTAPSLRRRIVAWGTWDAVGYADEREFLFEVVLGLRQRIDFDFWIYGANDMQALEPYVNRLAKHSIKVQLYPLMSLKKFHASLKNAAVGLHPIADSNEFSQGKSFGKVNSYMQCGVPIVVHRKLDYPNFFRDVENGMLAMEVEEWVDKIYQLLVNPELRDKIAEQARYDFEHRLTSDFIADQVSTLLTSLLSKDRIPQKV